MDGQRATDDRLIASETTLPIAVGEDDGYSGVPGVSSALRKPATQQGLDANKSIQYTVSHDKRPGSSGSAAPVTLAPLEDHTPKC